MTKEELEEEIKASLEWANPFIGGPLGYIPSEHREEILSEMRSQKLIGPRGGLTRKGAERAKILSTALWNQALFGGEDD